MEEKKFKINFMTVLLIIAIIVIILMGIVILLKSQQESTYIAQINNETTAYSSLSAKYNSLLNKYDELQNKLEQSKNVTTSIPLNGENQVDTNTIQNNQIDNNTITNNTTIQNNVSNNTTVNQNTNTTTVLTNAEALAIGKEKYNDAIQSYWNDPTVDELQKITINGLEYSKITDATYISSMKQLYSTNGYANIFLTFKTIVEANNGDYYIALAARGSNIYYVGNELVVSNITDSKIEFIAKETYRSENDASITYVENNAFVLVKENGEWKVDKFELPN